ncbi:MAG: hypothetical protein E7576_02975 [Ruminococcaceae bacterium]|nr:hypothetical protein [Oscillospiraceae bacterium]
MITVNNKTIAPETISEVGLIRAVLQNLSEETNLTMKAISEKNNEMFPDDKITPQNLNNKLARNRMYFEEIAHIAESLGFDIIFSQREKPKEEPKGIPEPIKKTARQVERNTNAERWKKWKEDIEITVPVEIEGMTFLIKGKSARAAARFIEINAENNSHGIFFDEKGQELMIDGFPEYLDYICRTFKVTIQPPDEI